MLAQYTNKTEQVKKQILKLGIKKYTDNKSYNDKINLENIRLYCTDAPTTSSAIRIIFQNIIQPGISLYDETIAPPAAVSSTSPSAVSSRFPPGVVSSSKLSSVVSPSKLPAAVSSSKLPAAVSSSMSQQTNTMKKSSTFGKPTTNNAIPSQKEFMALHNSLNSKVQSDLYAKEKRETRDFIKYNTNKYLEYYGFDCYNKFNSNQLPTDEQLEKVHLLIANETPQSFSVVSNTLSSVCSKIDPKKGGSRKKKHLKKNITKNKRIRKRKTQKRR
jgi:hypothetical protein